MMAAKEKKIIAKEKKIVAKEKNLRVNINLFKRHR